MLKVWHVQWIAVFLVGYDELQKINNYYEMMCPSVHPSIFIQSIQGRSLEEHWKPGRRWHQLHQEALQMPYSFSP